MASIKQKISSSIRLKLLLVVIGVLFLSTVTGTGFIALNERTTLTRFLHDKGHSLGAYIANISQDPILLKDSIQLDAIVTEAIKDGDVVYALIQDPVGNFLTTPMASFNGNLPAVADLLAGLGSEAGAGTILDAIKGAGLANELVQPVKIDESDYGTVLIGLSDQKIRQQLNRTVVFVLAVNISMALILGVIFFVISKRIILNPIARFCEMANHVAQGDLSKKLEVVSSDELGVLTSSLNGMVGSLNQMVRQVNSATEELGLIAVNLTSASDKVMEAAEVQAEGVSSTSSAVTEIDASIHGVTASVESLAASAAGSLSSIMEMVASVEEVAGNTETLSQSVAEVSTSIAQMAAAIKQVGGGVDSLLEAASGTAASISQMDLSIRQVEQNAADASQISEEVRQDAEMGQQTVAAAISGMDEIKQSSDITFEAINSLSRRAADIGAILSVIDEVADQTKLLSLNASIAAAQAGEHGRGFAVIADEIKVFAERTRTSTQEITQLITAVQDETERAVAAIRVAEKSITSGKNLQEQSGTALKKIFAGVQKTSDQMQEIAQATIELSSGSRLIQKAMEQVSDMVRRIAMATREQGQGSDLIMASSERMKQITTQVLTSTREQSKAGSFIADSTENITSQIGKIRTACEEQTKGSSRIAMSVEDIHSSATVNLDATRTMKESAKNLFAQIEALKQEIKVFKV